MAESILVTGKKISSMELVTNVTGNEKIPTGQPDDLAITPNQIADHTITRGDLASHEDLSQVEVDLTTQIETLAGDLASEEAARIAADNLKVDKEGSVSSVAGRVGDVVLAPSDVVVEGFGSQEDVNKYVPKPFLSGYSYGLGERVVLTSGEVVKSLVGGNVGDPNVDMAGWVSAVSDSLSGTIRTFITPEEGVDTVTGVADGAYFNVRSSSDESYLYEYQNVGGSAVATGKSYPSSNALNNILHNNLKSRDAEGAHPASAILDASGKDQQQINNDQININTILNKTGITETLAETVDATPFLQALINAMPDGMTLDLLGKTFRVKKNTGFTSDYPKGDQPCLVIKDKKNITITNGKLIVKEHGQGAFDCINSSGELNLEIEGAGTNFPKLDGRTGRGEKGVSDAGYFDQAFYDNGDPRNNSVDTSNYSGGGYGGQFPQWGGGTASTWGTWNGGFIKNFGDGVYIKNSDFLIHRCNIHGFNGFGVVVVEGSVTITQSKLHHCYSGGYLTRAYGDGAGKVVSSVHIENNEIYDVGHPDSQVTDFSVDPGYGVSSSNAGQLRTGVERYTVINNTFKRCKRKAIDAHHAYYTNHSGNIIEDCGFGVYVTIYASGRAPESLHVNDNFIKNTRQCIRDRACGVMVAATNTTNPFTGTVHVCDNTVVDVGMDLTTYNAHKAEYTGGGIGVIVLGVETAIMTGNSVLINPTFVADIGIADNLTSALGSPRSTIVGNTVRGLMRYGIFSRHNGGNASNAVLTGASTVVGNIVDVTPKVDIPVGESAYAIFIDPDSVVEGNKIIARSGVKKYYNPSTKGEYVTFRYNLATKALSIVTSSSDKVGVEFDNIQVTVLNNTVKFQINRTPAIAGIDSATITELGVPQTSTYFGVSYLISEQAWNSVTLSFYSLNNGVKTDVPLSSLNGGILQIKLFLN